jgi:hypothetical protein
VFLTENVSHVNGRGGFHPFTLPAGPPDQHNTEDTVCPYLSPLVYRLFGFPFALLAALLLVFRGCALCHYSSIDDRDRTYGQWAAPIGLTGFTLINATWAGHRYGKCGPDGQ